MFAVSLWPKLKPKLDDILLLEGKPHHGRSTENRLEPARAC